MYTLCLFCRIAEACECTIRGDPHHMTFDNGKIDFQGRCTYTLINIDDPDCPLIVYGKNIDTGRASGATALYKLIILVKSNVIIFGRNHEVIVSFFQYCMLYIYVYTPIGNGPGHSISYNIEYEPRKDSAQLVRPRSLIRVFAVRLKSYRSSAKHTLSCEEIHRWHESSLGAKAILEEIIMKTCLYNFDSLKPHFYIVKLGLTGVYIIFSYFCSKHRLWVPVRTASPRRF